jgi:hypothetical protein
MGSCRIEEEKIKLSKCEERMNKRQRLNTLSSYREGGNNF